MWSVSDIKERAWNLLRGTYWKSFAAGLIISAIFYGVSATVGVASYFLMIFLMIVAALGLPWVFNMAQNSAMALFSLFYFTFLSMYSLLSSIVGLFLFFPFIVGLCHFFMVARQGNTDLSSIFFSFRQRYVSIVKIGFFQYLFIFLWSLLFVIPGIVKKYEYAMIPYILAENPHLSRKQVFALSRAMTDGEKWKMFVLDLSFIGWHLLAFFTCMIGELFLLPYLYAAKAELYAAMRDKLFYLHQAAPTELPGFGVTA